MNRLQKALGAAGIEVWRDKDSLWPGEDWRIVIRRAIQDDSLAFIACFSKNSAARDSSYQNEELALAIDEYRKRPLGAQWLFPVRLDDCEVPRYQLGAGRELGDLQRTDLFGVGRESNLVRLVTAVQGVVRPQESAAAIAQELSSDASASVADAVKALLRDPFGDIKLEELLDRVVDDVVEKLDDVELFPTEMEGSDGLEVLALVRAALENYEAVLGSLTEVVVLAGLYGKGDHERVWSRMIEGVGATVDRPSGNSLLLSIRQYPLVWLMHAMAVACIDRDNYGTLRAALVDAQVQIQGRLTSAVAAANSASVFDQWKMYASAVTLVEEGAYGPTNELLDNLASRRIGGRYTPVADRIRSRLRPVFARAIRSDQSYQTQFDAAEVLLDALALHASQHRFGYIAGFGAYTWRHVHSDAPPEKVMADRLESAGAASPLIGGGLFGGSLPDALKALADVNEMASRVRRERW